MSLARAFTTRRSKGSVDLGESSKFPSRSGTLHKPSSQQPLRSKISSPVELVHTTNMLSYNAPDIHPRRPSRSDSLGTKISQDELDSPTTAESTPPTSPEAEPPHLARPPQANHLSSYFMAPGAALASCPPEPPMIPKRSPSHTKKNSIDALARKQSQSRMSRDSDQSNPGLTFSRSSSTSTRASSTSNHSAMLASKEPPPPIPQHQPTTIYHPINYGEPIVQPPPQPQQPKQLQPQLQPAAPAKKEASPFGNELAQVTELAEEIGAKGRLDVIYEDEQYLRSRGLVQMSADEYLNEIHTLMSSFWPQPQPSFPAQAAPLWI